MRVKCFLVSCLVILCIASSAFGAEFMLEVQGPNHGYLDHNLGNRLTYILSGINGFNLKPNEIPRDPYAPLNFDIQQRIDRATSENIRYFVWIEVLEAGSAIKSSTLLPAVFKAHKRKYGFEAEMRIIDSKLGKIVVSERFKVSRNGARSIACLDLDASGQPALAISHPRQIAIFADMEDEIAEKIAEKLVEFARSIQPHAKDQ